MKSPNPVHFLGSISVVSLSLAVSVSRLGPVYAVGWGLTPQGMKCLLPSHRPPADNSRELTFTALSSLLSCWDLRVRVCAQRQHPFRIEMC